MTAAKNAIVSCLLNYSIRMFVKSAIKEWCSKIRLDPIFAIALLSVWMSDETLPLVFDILLLSV